MGEAMVENMVVAVGLPICVPHTPCTLVSTAAEEYDGVRKI